MATYADSNKRVMRSEFSDEEIFPELLDEERILVKSDDAGFIPIEDVLDEDIGDLEDRLAHAIDLKAKLLKKARMRSAKKESADTAGNQYFSEEALSQFFFAEVIVEESGEKARELFLDHEFVMLRLPNGAAAFL